jgi:hypothetical protein
MTPPVIPTAEERCRESSSLAERVETVLGGLVFAALGNTSLEAGIWIDGVTAPDIAE